MTKRERRIGDLYVSGETQQHIGDRYGLTRQRVCQILHELGLTREVRPLSERTVFLGIHITEETQKKLKEKAKKAGKSVSLLASSYIDKGLAS